MIVFPSSSNVIFWPLLSSSFSAFVKFHSFVLFDIKRWCLFSPSLAFKLCSEMLCFTLLEINVVLLTGVCLGLLSCLCECVMCFLHLIGPVWFIVLSYTPGYTFFCRFYDACIEYLDNIVDVLSFCNYVLCKLISACFKYSPVCFLVIPSWKLSVYRCCCLCNL